MNRQTIFIHYSEASGLLVNSNIGPNGFVKQMLGEFLSEPTKGKELTLCVTGREVVFTQADELENRVASLSEALASREEMLDLARTQRDRLALELRGVLESNQLLRDARLTGKHKSVIEMRTGGLAYAEQQAREALAAL